MLWFRPSHLDEYLAQGDEGRAELSEEQAADEEIALLLSEELGDKMQKSMMSCTQAWRQKHNTDDIQGQLLGNSSWLFPGSHGTCCS